MIAKIGNHNFIVCLCNYSYIVDCGCSKWSWLYMECRKISFCDLELSEINHLYSHLDPNTEGYIHFVYENIKDIVVKSTKLSVVNITPVNPFSYCVSHDKFISIKTIKSIPSEVFKDTKIVHYNFLDCIVDDVSSSYLTYLLNGLPAHSETLRICCGSEVLEFAWEKCNLPIGLKKMTLVITKLSKKNEDILKQQIKMLHGSIKIPFGCNLFINIDQ